MNNYNHGPFDEPMTEEQILEARKARISFLRQAEIQALAGDSLAFDLLTAANAMIRSVPAGDYGNNYDDVEGHQ